MKNQDLASRVEKAILDDKTRFDYVEVSHVEAVEPEAKPKKRSITELAKKHMAKREKMQSTLYSWGEYKSGAGLNSIFAKHQELGGFDEVDGLGFDSGISGFESLMIQLNTHIESLVKRDQDLIQLEYRHITADRVLYWSNHYQVSELKYEKEHRRITLKMALEFKPK